MAALDCGFKFYPEWRPAIKQFLSCEGCPLIFTEFNQGDQVRYGLLIYKTNSSFFLLRESSKKVQNSPNEHGRICTTVWVINFKSEVKCDLFGGKLVSHHVSYLRCLL